MEQKYYRRIQKGMLPENYNRRIKGGEVLARIFHLSKNEVGKN